MIRSMTGYGKKVVQKENYTITVEMRSVNNRFLDISLKMPRYLLYLEEEIKKVIRSSFQRGKLEIFMLIAGEGNLQKNLQVDWKLLDQYMENISKIKTDYQLDGELSTSALLSVPEIFSVAEEEKSDAGFKENILSAVAASTEEMLIMRQKEGTFLEKDIRERLDILENYVEKLEELRPVVIEEYRERIYKRLNHYLENQTDMDEARIHQEVALLAEKGEITEELIRVKSHINQMKETLQAGGSIGRKLDFICQELHREANTIGAKSTSTEISQVDVLLKTEIEKIKEQVQNIE